MITPELKELFEDKEIPWDKILRELATAYGTDATVHDIAMAYTDAHLPSKEIDGKLYVAGYKGSGIISIGPHEATLLDITQNGGHAKLMFVLSNKYLFQTLDTFRVEDIVELTKQIGKPFSIIVAHEKIENTGATHAIIMKSDLIQ